MVQATAGRSAPPLEVPNRELVEQSVRFSQAFLRWLGRSRDGTLAYPRLRVLESLHCNGPARMRDLANELGLPARNLTTLADALEGEQLLRRTPHPTDRRATILEITEAGSATLESALGPQLLEISALFDVLTATEKKSLLAALSTISTAMETRESHDT
jgi:DNA-binding MarR family transcriptional regulator